MKPVAFKSDVGDTPYATLSVRPAANPHRVELEIHDDNVGGTPYSTYFDCSAAMLRRIASACLDAAEALEAAQGAE